MYKNKYLKYKNKYLELKKKLQFGGASLHLSDDLVNELICTVRSNIRENIRTESQSMVELSQPNITRLGIEGLVEGNKLGQGQYGIVYDLSPSYVIKKVAIRQSNYYGDRTLQDKSADILKEIRMGYYAEYLNQTIPLYSGNLTHFKDSTYYYLIMKKFKSIDDLESNIKTTCNLFDVAISLISQLYVLTKKLSTLTISHGDEKFDNLLFEDTREIPTNFEYLIGSTTYKIKNCGFRLRLIDWGEINDIISINTMKPLWDSAWLDAINKGIQGIKKGSGLNKSAPTTDYLVSVCKLIGDLGLNLTYDLFETKYAEFINRYPDYTPQQMEQFKLDLLLSDGSDATKIFNKIGDGNIGGLYDTFNKLKNSQNSYFLSWEDKLDFDQIDFDKLPRFKATKIIRSDTWTVKYCNPTLDELPKEITYQELNRNLNNYLKYRTTGKDPNTIGECKHFERFVSGISESFNITRNISNSKINRTIYEDELKSYFDTLLNIDSVFVNGDNTYDSYNVTIVKSHKYLLLLLTDRGKIGEQTIRLNILPFLIPFDDPENVNLNNDTKIKLNSLGGAVATDKPQIKQLFQLIKNSILGKDIQVVIFPLGFFHFHLTYNELLDKYFGVVHGKFEITSELGSTELLNSQYLKKRVQYEEKPDTLVNLSQGTAKDNKLEHNYIFEMDSSNNVKVYKLNCDPQKINGLNILGGGTFGINDNFFNSHKFADVNYYHDPRIGEKEDYVIIAKTTSNDLTAGSDDLFFNRNIPFKCPTGIIDPDTDIKNEVAGLGLNSEQITLYVRLRKAGRTMDAAAGRAFSM
jgi:hypothetical protein